MYSDYLVNVFLDIRLFIFLHTELEISEKVTLRTVKILLAVKKKILNKRLYLMIFCNLRFGNSTSQLLILLLLLFHCKSNFQDHEHVLLAVKKIVETTYLHFAHQYLTAVIVLFLAVKKYFFHIKIMIKYILCIVEKKQT